MAPKKPDAAAPVAQHSILWLRKGLRLHDNPALHAALAVAPETLTPVFCLDPWFLKEERVGVNRLQFLMDSLHDLDSSLQSRGSRLVLLRGKPEEVFPAAFRDWGVTRLCFEADTEPYALKRDAAMRAAAEAAGVEVVSPVSHTLYDTAEMVQRNGGKPPLTYKAFEKLMQHVRSGSARGFEIAAPNFAGQLDVFMQKAGPPPAAAPDPPAQLPPPHEAALKADTGIPTVQELGYSGQPSTSFKGGETEALSRLDSQLSDHKWVAAFAKPDGDPALFAPPATTVLSPYLKFGCLSARLFYARLMEIQKAQPKHTKPPVSLEGQLLWREFFYTAGGGTPNFDRMVGNPVCKQIDWDENEEHYRAWDEGRTGYPWIDAIMRQLHEQGWMHHLARHSVACFLTRGDLYISWERGRDTFDRLLIDADHFINNGNWMWLSCSAFFQQYYRVYSPVAFAKKYKFAPYIRRFVPELKDFPDNHLLEPWKAPLGVQKAAGCIIGTDYPEPLVDHTPASKANIVRIKAAYDAAKTAKAAGDTKAAPSGRKPAKKQATLAAAGFKRKGPAS